MFSRICIPCTLIFTISGWNSTSFFMLIPFIVYIIISSNIATNIMKYIRQIFTIAIFQIRKLRRLREIKVDPRVTAQVIGCEPKVELVTFSVMLFPLNAYFCNCDTDTVSSLTWGVHIYAKKKNIGAHRIKMLYLSRVFLLLVCNFKCFQVKINMNI